MTTILTICSANYLAHAKTLGQSLARHNPDAHFVIGLVDRLPKELAPDYCAPFEMIAVEDLGIPQFADLAKQYNIVELNTAVKPFYMEHLYSRDANTSKVLYLDPDMFVLDSLKPLEDKLEHHNIIVTPHSCTYDDTEANIKTELAMLATGVFNLGFIGTARSEETLAFLSWWKKRMPQYAYARRGDGLFYDQFWINLVPLYFKKVHVETDPGYNMCYWNLFERSLVRKDGHYLVNGQHNLVLYHFSSYSPKKPDLLENRNPNSLLANHPNLKPLFDDYQTALIGNQYDTLSSFPYAFALKPPQTEVVEVRKPSLKRFLKKLASKLLSALPMPVQRCLNRIAEFITWNAAQGLQKRGDGGSVR
jgi:hypothetical protein